MAEEDRQTPERVRLVVIGAGFGGLGAARALRQAGHTGEHDVVVLERGDDVGGVWRDNTYPNAACDVPSPLYSWSWALNPHWSRRYSRQPEILAYLRAAATREGLLDVVRTGTEVASCVLDETSGTWTVTAVDGRAWEADAVVSAVGQLSNPAIPSVPGADSFAGPAFHSAEWRHDVDLAGKRVAVVGTGASAIQFVPGIVDVVGTMTVFQRSAPYVLPKPDHEYDLAPDAGDGLVGSERPGLGLRAERSGIFWLSERLNAALGGQVRYAKPFLTTLKTAWRASLRRHVPDPELRAKLRPDYEIGCKRILFSNDWYPALARPHVSVVSEAVAGIEPDGVRTADGVLHEADVIIWGTGFAATGFLSPMRVSGVGGLDLHESWDGGARAHLGLMTPGFPNLFLVYGPNTNLGGSSIIAMLEAQAGWIADVVTRLRPGQQVSVRPDVASAYDREMQDRLRASAWSGCESWYLDGERITTNWPGKVAEFQDRTAEVDWSQLTVSAAG